MTTQATTIREQHKLRIIDYLSNPDNDFVSRTALATEVLGISVKNMYKHFRPSELCEIESEAFELRKKNSTKERAEVYKAMLKAAKEGDVPAMREYLDRVEGKVVNKNEDKITLTARLRRVKREDV